MSGTTPSSETPVGKAPERTNTWELVVRARKMPRWAAVAALAMFLTFVVLGILLGSANTGVYFRLVDQIAMVLLGAFFGSLFLLLARPRLRVGASGVGVRNFFSERVVPWETVGGLSFRTGGSWARLELPEDEYIPVLAIQSTDRGHAVAAVEKFRELEGKYSAELSHDS
ncbi:PH domain-containing protein [Hoyosella rhizosphaerae]|uniref:Membrane protein n=1 Tax=Hoyosella rhizosphaerae TaxID=1755582 RepID=A0A916XAJ2_9ACTN|nr:PH domain-containing protein [Hoyosella rhizosphaerae]MBN4926480.1 PH domain-containing protein [Hoyosella rhizosphaerae]GGC59025.1 membrane protein [Hoyosella rhizosphaerae]